MTSSPDVIEKSRIFTALQEGVLDLKGQFLFGSNYTFFANIVFESHTIPVVYKPSRGERPLWDFPVKSLAKREVAAYIVSEALGWGLVPPTIYRLEGPIGPGSVQLFIEHNPNYHYFTFEDHDKQRLRPAAAFDMLINNADRKGGHILCDSVNHLWLIDHGICFHVEEKLRTVLWDFAGEEIPSSLLEDINRLEDNLKKKGDTWLALKPFLRLKELTALRKRARQILELPVFPFPKTRMAYPWPPV
jgi:uncharacterized repeat protein (TIGR03843 family)